MSLIITSRHCSQELATLFLNSTAHYQHSYWRDMEPQKFTASTSPTADHQNAIQFGYTQMDRLLGRVLRSCASDVTVIMATGLSQQPFLKCEGIGGQRFFRAKDLNALLSALDLGSCVVQPVMTHQYRLRFKSSEAAVRATQALSSLRLANGTLLMQVDIDTDKAISCGCQLRTPVTDDATFVAPNVAQPLRFFEHFYQIEEVKSGCHHPDGALWIGTGVGRVHAGKVSILDIFPTVLDILDIRYTPSEGHPFSGRSLLPLWETEIVSKQRAA